MLAAAKPSVRSGGDEGFSAKRPVLFSTPLEPVKVAAGPLKAATQGISLGRMSKVGWLTPLRGVHSPPRYRGEYLAEPYLHLTLIAHRITSSCLFVRWRQYNAFAPARK